MSGIVKAAPKVSCSLTKHRSLDESTVMECLVYKISPFCMSNSSIDYVTFYRESYLINQYFLGLFEITNVKPVLKALHRKSYFLVHIIGLLFRSSSDHVYKK